MGTKHIDHDRKRIADAVSVKSYEIADLPMKSGWYDPNLLWSLAAWGS